jgi:hypothetical protein
MEKSFLELLQEDVKPFRPFATYDRETDTLRIQLRDCSITEDERNSTLTFLRDNYPDFAQSERAGLIVHGARRFIAPGVRLVGMILAEIEREFPEESAFLRPLREIASSIELYIDF